VAEPESPRRPEEGTGREGGNTRDEVSGAGKSTANETAGNTGNSDPGSAGTHAAGKEGERSGNAPVDTTSDGKGNSDGIKNGNGKSYDRDVTTLKEAPLLALKGFCMGSADVVPGVSGGTMALILGIYQRLIDAIKSFDLAALRALLRFDLKGVFGEVHWLFMGVLLTGILSAVMFFTKVVPLQILMYTHPELIYGLFFGLIVGSVFLLLFTFRDFRAKHALLLLAGLVVGYQVVTLVPTDTPENPVFVFLAGSVAITAMILPGISGSFILLILRKYDYILGSFGKLGTSETLDALAVLIPFGLGMVTGIVLFSRLLSWLLKWSYWGTLSVLIGFMAGSLYVIWPYQVREYTESVRTEEVATDARIVSDLREAPMPAVPPGYLRLGDIVNPDSPASEQRIVVEDVRFKLISSKPFMPDYRNPDNDARLSDGRNAFYEGILMMFIGMVVVGLVGWYGGRVADHGHPGSLG
jgi:putative membrane protein